jgi:hypothetical protein
VCVKGVCKVRRQSWGEFQHPLRRVAVPPPRLTPYCAIGPVQNSRLKAQRPAPKGLSVPLGCHTSLDRLWQGPQPAVIKEGRWMRASDGMGPRNGAASLADGPAQSGGNAGSHRHEAFRPCCPVPRSNRTRVVSGPSAGMGRLRDARPRYIAGQPLGKKALDAMPEPRITGGVRAQDIH